MIAFDAECHRQRSFSHWGTFDVWRERVEVMAKDLGIVKTPFGEQYVTELSVGGEKRISSISADPELNIVLDHTTGLDLANRRIAADMAALAEMGVDVESVDFGTIRNIA